MNIDNIDTWWCCLDTSDANMLRAVSGAQAGILPFILADVYDAFWSTWGIGIAEVRREAWEGYFGVTHGTITGEGEDEIPVVFLDLTFWTPLWVWIFEGHDDCPDGCYVVNFDRST